MFIDSHAHISSEKLKGRTEEIISALSENNIKCVVEIGCDLESSERAVELAKKHDQIFAVVGFQPEECEKCNENSLKTLEKLAKNNKVVGIGEIGLDYFYGSDKKEKQKEVLIKQLELAHKLNKNVIIHMRDCEEDMKEILLKHKNLISKNILFHCFNSNVEFMNFVLENFKNAYFAFGGICTYKNSTMPLLIKNCPIQKLLVETDSPYLTPMPLRGKCLNEPKFIKYSYYEISEIKNLLVSELETIVEQNFKNFLGD